MRKGRTPAGFVPEPLRNRSRKNAETSLSEPIRKKGIYCPNHAKPQPENCRNVAFGTYEKCRKEKNAETLLLEPTKNKKKVASSKAKPLRNVRLGSLQATRAQVHAKQQDSCSSRARQVRHRSTTIFCNNFLGALPLTATRGRRIYSGSHFLLITKSGFQRSEMDAWSWVTTDRLADCPMLPRPVIRNGQVALFGGWWGEEWTVFGPIFDLSFQQCLLMAT